MRRFLLVFIGAAFLGVAGCNTRATRLAREPELFSSLDSATREKIARGEIDLGYTPELVRLALGEPSEQSASPDDGSGQTTWVYRTFHRDPKDIIAGGYRRRVVFDPVLRSETVIVEPIDDRLAAKLAPQSLRVTFRDGRVSLIERIPEL